jgi:hypothetical protein
VFAGAAAVWVLANGAPALDWVRHNASSAENDGRGARTGLFVRRLTSEDAVIAVTSAGSVPYFSRRTAIDILGKSDPVIARMAPVNSFVPGHNKWNLDRSIRDGKPTILLPRAAGEVDYLRLVIAPGRCFANPDPRGIMQLCGAEWRPVSQRAPSMTVPPRCGLGRIVKTATGRRAARTL